MSATTIAGGTKIEWADFTFNPWWGCERVSPACAHCYADTFARRIGMPTLWDRGSRSDKNDIHDFRFFADAHWDEPLKWARTAPTILGRRPRVFCASMADVFEEREELHDARLRLFDLIAATPELDWLILTKRPEFARDWLRKWWLDMDDGEYHPLDPNIWLGVSIENSRYTWRADVLREIPCAVRFISGEPLLGSLFKAPSASRRDDVGAVRRLARPARDAEGSALTEAPAPRGVAPLDLAGVDWLIIGGESGHRARRTDPTWIQELIDACLKQRMTGNFAMHRRDDQTAIFVKQLGKVLGRELGCTDSKGGDWDEWPDRLRIREHPSSVAA